MFTGAKNSYAHSMGMLICAHIFPNTQVDCFLLFILLVSRLLQWYHPLQLPLRFQNLIALTTSFIVYQSFPILINLFCNFYYPVYSWNFITYLSPSYLSHTPFSSLEIMNFFCMFLLYFRTSQRFYLFNHVYCVFQVFSCHCFSCIFRLFPHTYFVSTGSMRYGTQVFPPIYFWYPFICDPFQTCR